MNNSKLDAQKILKLGITNNELKVWNAMQEYPFLSDKDRANLIDMSASYFSIYKKSLKERLDKHKGSNNEK